MRKRLAMSWMVIGVLWLAGLACGGQTANTPVPGRATDRPEVTEAVATASVEKEPTEAVAATEVSEPDGTTGGATGDYVVKEFKFEAEGVTIQATGHMEVGYFIIAGVVENTSGEAYDIWVGIELEADGNALGVTTTTGEQDGVTTLGGIIPADIDNTFYYVREMPAGTVPDDFKMALRVQPQTMGSCVYEVADWEAKPDAGTILVTGSTSEECQCDNLEIAPEIWVGEYLANTNAAPVTVADGTFELTLMEDLDYPLGGEVKNVRGGCYVLP